jgi:hypothetical protein
MRVTMWMMATMVGASSAAAMTAATRTAATHARWHAASADRVAAVIASADADGRRAAHLARRRCRDGDPMSSSRAMPRMMVAATACRRDA